MISSFFSDDKERTKGKERGTTNLEIGLKEG
jgi:hypothetical protein